MNLNDLLAGRFDQYFAKAQSGQALWLFVHVPKTAGSSLNGELIPILAPAHHIFIDYSQLSAEEAQRGYEQLFDAAVDNFIEAAQSHRYRYCTGHINAAQVARIAEHVPDVRPVTLLRDPVARYVSDYRYQRSPLHPGHEAFAAAYPRLQDYLELESEWNKLTTTLLPAALRASGDATACADWLTSTYAFVGVQECYEVALHALSWFAGVPRRSTVRRRINTPTPATAVRLTPALEAKIRARNAMDIALYDEVAPRFLAIANDLSVYLNRVAPRPPQGS